MAKVYIEFRANDFRDSYTAEAGMVVFYDRDRVCLDDENEVEAKVIRHLLVDERTTGNWVKLSKPVKTTVTWAEIPPEANYPKIVEEFKRRYIRDEAFRRQAEQMGVFVHAGV